MGNKCNLRRASAERRTDVAFWLKGRSITHHETLQGQSTNIKVTLYVTERKDAPRPEIAVLIEKDKQIIHWFPTREAILSLKSRYQRLLDNWPVSTPETAAYVA